MAPTDKNPEKNSENDKPKKKYKLPTVKYFLKIKRNMEYRKEPVWKYLEREMQERKKQNFKVSLWLRFLKELRYYRFCELRRQIRIINKECGPPWFCQFSSEQKRILKNLHLAIHADIVEENPTRCRQALWDMGLTLKISNSMFKHALANCAEGSGVFIWILYSCIYKLSPSSLRDTYDFNSKLLLSALVFLDIEDCIEMFDKLLFTAPTPKPPIKRKPPPKKVEIVPFYPYLENFKVPYACKGKKKREFTPRSINYVFKLRTKQSYDRLIQSTNFLEIRKSRFNTNKYAPRECHYNFWEPPVMLGKKNPKERSLLEKSAMLTKKAKVTHNSRARQAGTALVKRGGVSFNYPTGPKFVIDSIAIMPTAYIFIHGGYVAVHTPNGNMEYIIMMRGFVLKERKIPKTSACHCVSKWEKRILSYVKDAKCKCGHYYDIERDRREGSKAMAVQQMVHPATRYGPMWIDEALMYNIDIYPQEEFIKSRIAYAQRSAESVKETTRKTFKVTDLKPKEIVRVLLADLSDTHLLIPHLPKANVLPILLEWVRKRIHGPLTVDQHKKLLLRSQRRWLQLRPMDFRARAYRIPFSHKQLSQFNWMHRHKLQKIFQILLEDFTTRNRIMQLDQSRMWWSTMYYNCYPGKSFLDLYFTLMPAKLTDTYFYNPYPENQCVI